MKTTSNCLGYNPPEAMWSSDNTDDGYYSLNQSISRALAGRNHLGFYPETAPWEKLINNFGYFSINGGITRALRKLSGHC